VKQNIKIHNKTRGAELSGRLSREQRLWLSLFAKSKSAFAWIIQKALRRNESRRIHLRNGKAKEPSLEVNSVLAKSQILPQDGGVRLSSCIRNKAGTAVHSNSGEKIKTKNSEGLLPVSLDEHSVPQKKKIRYFYKRKDKFHRCQSNKHGQPKRVMR